MKKYITKSLAVIGMKTENLLENDSLKVLKFIRLIRDL